MSQYRQIFCFYILVGISSFCFLSYITSKFNITTNKWENVPEFENYNFQFSIVISIALTIPILLDLFVDLLFRLVNFYSITVKWSLLLLLITLLSSSLTIFFYVIPFKDFRLLPSLYSFSLSVIISTGLIIINAYGNSVWRWRYVIVISSLYSLSETCKSYTTFTSGETNNTIQDFGTVSEYFAVIIFSLLSLMWGRRMWLIMKALGSWAYDDLWCTFNVLALITFMLGRIVFKSIYNVRDVLNEESSYHINRVYAISAYTVISTIINLKFIRVTGTVSQMKREAETKRMLIGYFSHEIRTPLNSVLMGLQLIKREIISNPNLNSLLLSDCLISTIEESQAQCDSAVDILNDLLLYERIEEGIIDLNFTPMAMKSFIENKLSSFLPISREKDVRLELLFTELSRLAPQHYHSNRNMDHVYCRGDEEKLGRILRTLFMNAIESSPAGSAVLVKVDLIKSLESMSHLAAVRRTGGIQGTFSSLRSLHGSKSKKPPAKHVLRIMIVDDGPPMSEKESDDLFENALDFTAGVLHHRQGKSLGLWISQRIMLLHKGNLYHASDGHQSGNTFILEIPAYFSSSTGRVSFSQSSSSARVSEGFWAAPVLSAASSSSRDRERSRAADRDRSPTLMEDRLNNSNDLIEMVSGTIFRRIRNSQVNATIYPRVMQSDLVPEYTVPTRDRLHHLSTIPSMNNTISHTSDGGSFSISTPSDIGSSSHTGLDEDINLCRSAAINNLEMDDIESSFPRRILVVDDAPMNRKMLCRLLLGYCDSTVEAVDGVMAVDKVRESLIHNDPFVLILIDYQMPNMDGPTAVNKMRILGYKGPIIGVTGNSLATHVKTFTSHGADRVVAKPLNFSALTRTLIEMGYGNILDLKKSIPSDISEGTCDLNQNDQPAEIMSFSE